MLVHGNLSSSFDIVQGELKVDANTVKCLVGIVYFVQASFLLIDLMANILFIESRIFKLLDIAAVVYNFNFDGLVLCAAFDSEKKLSEILAVSCLLPQNDINLP